MSTIRDVAKMAQVSAATVSRVINEDDTYKISEETRNRVWQAVAELSYQLPPPRKQRVNHKGVAAKAGKIGCVISTTLKQFIDPFFMTILSGIEDRLKYYGYSISMVTTSGELKNILMSQDLLCEKLDGLILMDSVDEQTYEFLGQRVKYLVGIDTVHKEFDNVGYDHLGLSEMAVNYLYGCGYREIGFVGGSNKMRYNRKRSRRLMGYLSAMDDLGLSVHQEWVIDTQWSDENCAQQIAKLCINKNLPRAFYAASDLMAIAVLETLNEHKVKIPEEVAIIGVSDIEVAKFTSPPLTTVRLFTREMGIQAADLLVQRIEGGDALPRRVLLPYELIERKSTG